MDWTSTLFHNHSLEPKNEYTKNTVTQNFFFKLEKGSPSTKKANAQKFSLGFKRQMENLN